MRRRILASLLAFVMLFSLLPVNALADEIAGDASAAVVYGTYNEKGEWVQGTGSGTYTDPDTGVTLSKIAEPTGTPNEYEVTLTVETSTTTTTTLPGAAATVLVIDVSGSMAFCAECGSNRHSSDCKYHKGGWFADNSIQSNQTRLYAAQNAAKSFLDAYKGDTSGTGRYVSVVTFETYASTVLDWVDVSTQSGYNAAVAAINRLRADGGTNLQQGLVYANTQMSDEEVAQIDSTQKNVIALTDGQPTYYTKNESVYGPGGNSNQNVLDATEAAATTLKENAALYTVCFGVANELCWEKGDDISDSDSGWFGDSAEADCPYTVGEFLETFVATSADYAYNADNTDELNEAFEAITESITSGITGAGLTVDDPMAEGVEAELPDDEGVTETKDGFTWDLSSATPEEVVEGNTTYYTYTLTYTVTLDPTVIADFDEDAYYPLNGVTTLTIPGEPPVKINFPVPGVQGVLPTYTVTYAPGANGTLADADADGNVVHADIKYGMPTPAEPAVTPNGGYYFTGWDKTIAATVTADVTYTATYAKQDEVTVTGDQGEVVYNGSEQSLLTYKTAGLPKGYKLDVRYTGAAGTNVGTYNGVFDDRTLVIKDDKGNIVTHKFAVTLVPGSLTIKQLPITITSGSGTKVYDGTALTVSTHTITSGALASGDQITSISVSGSQTDVDSSENTVSNAVIKDGETDVTSNYAITYKPGTLTVTPDKNATIQVEAYNGTYDGNAHNGITSVVLKNGAGKVISTTSGWTITYRYDGVKHTSMPQFTDAGEYPIIVVAENNNYGTLTAEQVTAKISPKQVILTSPSDSKTYDGTALTTAASQVTGTDSFVNGEGVVITMTGRQLDFGSSENTFNYAAKAGTNLDNYTITPIYGTLTVHPITKQIVITADSNEKVYDGTPLTDSGYTYTESILVSGDVLTAVVTGSRTDAGSSDNVVTSYKVMRGSTDVTANYTNVETVNGTLLVKKRPVTLTSPNATKAYDGTALTTAASQVTGTDSFVNGEGVDINMTGSQLGFGSSENTFTYAAKPGTNLENYTITSNYGILNVTKSNTAQMTVNGYSGMYDGNAHTVTVTPVKGSFVAGTVWTYQYSVDGGAFSDTLPTYTDVGTHTIAVKASNPNYEDVTKTATIEITRRDVTLTSGSSSRPYNGRPLTNETVTTSGSGFVAGEGVANYSNFASITDVDEIDNTFDYTLKSNTKASNYKITKVPGKLEVTPYTTQLTITANSNSKTYDGQPLTDNGYTVNVEQLDTGDVLTAVVEGSQINVGDGVNQVTGYTITRNGVDVTSNYNNVMLVNGTLTVNKKSLTLTSATDSKAYDGTPLTNSTVTSDAFAANEGADYTVTGSQLDVGDSENEFTYKPWANTDLNNYEIETVFGTLTVTPAQNAIIVFAGTNSKKYDGTPLTDNGYTVTGDLVEGDELTAVVEGTITDFGTVDNVVKSHTIKRGDTVITNDYGNVTYKNGTLSITKRSVTLTFATDSKEYDGTPLTNANVTISGDGFVNGEGVTCNVTGSRTDAGTSANTFDKAAPYTFNAGTKAANYNIALSEGLLTVMKNGNVDVEGGVQLSATGYTGVYDGQAHNGVSGETVTGDVDGNVWEYFYKTGDGEYSTTVPQFTDVGTYTVDVKATTNNYEDLHTTVTVTITPAVITVTADNQSKLAGEADPALTYKYETPVASETPAFTGSLTRAEGETRGTYAIQQGTLALTDSGSFKASNYTLSFVPGTLTILQKELTVNKTVNRTSATVGDKLTYTIKVTNSGDVTLDNIIVKDQMLGIEKNIGTLAPGAFWTESYTYIVKFSDVGKTIINTAIAKADDGTEGEGSSEGTKITQPVKDDDDDDSPVLNTIDHYSYIIGYKDGYLKPYGTITRGEVATIFFRLLTDEAREKYWDQDSGYSDCGPDLWCNNAISTLSNMGIIDGYTDGTFRPYAKITRAQFAKIAVGFFETTKEEYQGYFTDVPEEAWFTEYVEAATRVGLIQGFGDGTFRPNTNITRAQACVIVNRALGRKPDEEHLLDDDDMITWPDNTPADWFYADMQEATNSHDYTWLTVRGEPKAMEQWIEKLPQRDWAALEHAWSEANDAPGGEVVKGR